jgi:hypothetical protein
MQEPKMNNDEFIQMMQASAKDAVVICSENYDLSLDYSVKSVEDIDQILVKIGQQTLDEKELFTYSYIFGAYLGEVFIRSFGGSWLLVAETEDEPPQTFVTLGNSTIAFPSKVYHMLQGNEDQPLADYFVELAQTQAD